MKNIFFVFVLLLAYSSWSKEIIVTSTNDTGIGSLREAISNSVAEDTIIIDVKGQIILNSSISFPDDDITLIGPFAKHSNITAGGGNTVLFQVNTKNNINFIGLGFNGGNGDITVASVISSLNISFESCVVENHASNNTGVFIFDNSSFSILNCSFINNSAQNSGAIYVESAPINSKIVNTTFFNNLSNNDGGGITMNTGCNVDLINNLFKGNVASSGQAIQSIAANTVNLNNNVFEGNGSASSNQIEGSGYVDFGGNVLVKNSGGDGVIPITGDLPFGSDLMLSGLLEDGYGLKYFRILSNASPLVNNGVTIAVAPDFDCRRVGRVLSPSTTATPGGVVDSGPFEFTPYTVTDYSGVNGLENIVVIMAGATSSDPKLYVDFNIPAYDPNQKTIISNPLDISFSTVINGYSQPGTAIAGPGLNGVADVTPAQNLINLTQTTSVYAGVEINTNNVTITGLDIYGFEQYGIYIGYRTNINVFGNHIGFFGNTPGSYTVSENKYAGIVVGTISSKIGGNSHWQRNVISGNGLTGSTTFNSNILFINNVIGSAIVGNFIGVQPTGNSSLALGTEDQDGIHCWGENIGGANIKVGDKNHLGRNIISGNKNDGIYFSEMGAGNTIDNNYIGLGYDGSTVIPNGVYGVSLVLNTVEINVGSIAGNVISGNPNSGISLLSSNFAVITNNLIGTDYTGTIAKGNFYGISISGSSSGNKIGIDTLSGNVISGSSSHGVYLVQGDGNSVQGNRIGTNKSGTAAIGNNHNAISSQFATNSLIGGTELTRNILSGSGLSGIGLTDNGSTTIAANFIGTDITGLSTIPNQNGIRVSDTHTAFVGSAFPNHNVVSGNTVNGIYILSDNVQVEGNLVGLNRSLSGAIGNNAGIRIENSQYVVIGGSNINIVSGNIDPGIILDNSSDCSIDRAIIGTNIAGTSGLGNLGSGIWLSNSDFNDIGVNNGNTIGGNQNDGIVIEETDSTLIQNNFIGILSDGTIIGNGSNGIRVATNSKGNLIGGDVSTERNVISANAQAGINLHSGTCEGNHIYGNYIGCDVTPGSSNSAGLGNNYGIVIEDGSHHNHVGADGDVSKKNIISANLLAGIYIHDVATGNNIVFKNYIGTTSDNLLPISNTTGILIDNCSTENFIGTDSHIDNSPNISGNENGIIINASSNQKIYNCRIGTLDAGTVVQPNDNGIVIQNSSSTNYIGGVGLKGNLISGNAVLGIAVNNCDDNLILGNKIGTDINGTAPLDNSIGVFINAGSGNIIGSPISGEGNLISSNSTFGVGLENNPSNTLIQNNKIGTDLTGNAVYLGSANGAGILVKNTTANTNVIGGDRSLNEGNLFADNGVSVYIENSSSQGVYGNVIGIKLDGSAYLGNNNANIGIYLKGGNNNRVGEVDNNRNIIANQAINIYVDNETNTDVFGNYIGTNLTADALLTGAVVTGIGIRVDSNSLNTRMFENVLSGLSNGIEIMGISTSNNTVQGNKIGTDLTGNNFLGNSNDGIKLYSASDINVIGGNVNDINQRNIISGNSGAAINIVYSGSVTISGNYIGSNMDGNATIQNGQGIVLHNDENANVASETRIGGFDLDSMNYIVGSPGNGITVGEDMSNIYIIGNTIGELPNGTAGGLSFAGVSLFSNAVNIKIGGINAGEGNKIVNCGQSGIFLTGSVNNVSFLGNQIYSTGLAADIGGGIFDGVTFDNTSGINNNIQMPIILDAFSCTPTNTTQVGLGLRDLVIGQDYLIEFYDNTALANGNISSEAYTFIKRITHTAIGTNDTAFFDLDVALSPGSLISCTVTDGNGNGSTSEFTENYSISAQPSAPNVSSTNETCNGSNDSEIIMTDVNGRVYYYGLDSDIPQFNATNDTTISVGPGIYTVTYQYLNGCQGATTSQTINSGGTPTFNDLTFADTCGLNLGKIIMDASANTTGDVGSEAYENITTATTLAINSFDNLTGGVYDVVLHTAIGGVGCVSDTLSLTVLDYNMTNNELDFVYDDFCVSVGVGVVTTGPSYTNGAYSLSVNPTSANINSVTGEITGSITAGSQYTVDYSYGTCLFQQTPSAINELDASFTFPDYCIATQSVVSPINPGGTFALNPQATDGASINPTSGEILSPIGGTTYTVEYTTNGSCPGVSIEDVVVMALPPIPIIVTNDTIVCDANQIPELFIVGSTNPIDWFTDETQPAVQTNSISFTPTTLIGGDNNFYGKATGANGCVSGFGTITLIRPDVANISTSDDVEICLGSEVEIFGLGGVTYNWLLTEEVDGKDSESILVSPISETYYFVEITDENDCVITDSVRVSILDPSLCNITIYTAFSPNGDGDNDVWIIDGIEGYNENIVYFYNRWGDLIDVIENYDNVGNAWGGKNKFTGNDVVPGTYFYIVESGGIKAQSSWVQVVR